MSHTSPGPGEPGGPDWCAWHDRIEPIPPEYFRICGECWHVFETEKELIDEHNRGLAEIGLSRRAVTHSADIWSCPLCSHDW